MRFNYIQTPIESLEIDKAPQEIQDQFYDVINNIPFVRRLIDPNRPRAKDLPRDQEGKIIVDITKPHILENMDYFRQTAIYYQKNGRYTDLRPNANPNSDYGKWLRQEVYRCWNGMVRESDGEWIPGDYYFLLNYIPILQTQKRKDGSNSANRIIDFPRVFEGHYYKFHYLDQARKNGNHAAELAKRGAGKAHPYSQKVLTPNGWTKWGFIKIGDKLYGDDGNITTVIDIPFNDEVDIYNVTLSDGRAIQCSLGHEFVVKDHRKGCERVLSLNDIIKNYILKRKVDNKNSHRREYNYRIKRNSCVNFKEVEIPIDAYTLGVLLGDGSFRNPEITSSYSFTCSPNDFDTYKNNIPYQINDSKAKCRGSEYSHSIVLPKGSIRSLGLHMVDSKNKFIPDSYLFNSKNVRLSLLQGLMDTDGTVDKRGIPEYSTSSEKLKDDIVFLARSLGYNVSVSSKIPKFRNKEYSRTYRIRIATNDKIFRLERKLCLLKKEISNYCRSLMDYTAIVDISFSHREWAKCVTVDNNSHQYLIGDFVCTHNSISVASMMAKRFILGESKDVKKKVTCYITASDKSKLVGGDQTLDKFQFDIDFLAENTQFPSKRLINTIQNMQWQMGYVDLDTGAKKGTLNAVVGKSSQADASKLRGSRGVLYVFEEAGSFSNLLQTYNNLRPSVEDGADVFGLLYMIGTAGDSESDFTSLQEIMYHPDGYNVYGVPNVYDIEGQGRPRFSYFFPGYLNREGCYDNDGNSDVIKAIWEILWDRYKVKYNSSDINSVTKRIAEIPLTPQEAIIRSRGNMFPVTELNARLAQIDNDPSFYDETYVGELYYDKENHVAFKPTADKPIRDFPLKDNKAEGAIEIFKMPESSSDGKVFRNRYIIGVDPIDDDEADTMSLYSNFVIDLWTDTIVAEYTGRLQYADSCYEITRKLAFFYNAKILYESNKKGIYAYFSRMNCTHLLAETPDYLKDKDLVKQTGIGNKAYGVNATKPVNDYANRLIRDWLLKEVPIIEDIDGEKVESTTFNLFRLNNRALIKELILFNGDINVDRVRALGMAMLYREQFMVTYGGDFNRARDVNDNDYLGNDSFFKRNFDNRFSNMNIKNN